MNVKHYLGHACVGNKDHIEENGLSYRYIVNNICVACTREREAITYARQKEIVKLRRLEIKAGHPKLVLGHPCVNGHVDSNNKTLRSYASGQCYRCVQISNEKVQKAKKEALIARGPIPRKKKAVKPKEPKKKAILVIELIEPIEPKKKEEPVVESVFHKSRFPIKETSRILKMNYDQITNQDLKSMVRCTVMLFNNMRQTYLTDEGQLNTKATEAHWYTVQQMDDAVLEKAKKLVAPGFKWPKH